MPSILRPFPVGPRNLHTGAIAAASLLAWFATGMPVRAAEPRAGRAGAPVDARQAEQEHGFLHITMAHAILNSKELLYVH